LQICRPKTAGREPRDPPEVGTHQPKRRGELSTVGDT